MDELQIFVFRNDEAVARFDALKAGSHTLGGGDDCDLLVIGAPCPNVLCQVQVSFDRKVHVLSAGVAQIKDPEKRYAARQRLAVGGFVDVDDFRLTLVVAREAPKAVIHHTGSVAGATERAPEILSPRGESMCLEFPTQGDYFRFDRAEDKVLLDRGKRTEDEAKSQRRPFIQLDQPLVSRNHCLVYRDGGRWLIQALDSTNGTWVNDQRLEPGSALELKAGSIAEVTKCDGYPAFRFSTLEHALARPWRVKPYLALVGKSEKMQGVREKIDKYGESVDVIVLVLGPSGSGKELAAVALHGRWCPNLPFLAVNCGAIPQSLIESERFGHEKGAFTGADRLRQGLFESAQGGVVLLDEIGELPLEAQAKLLRVLTTHMITRVGSTKAIPVHFRLVCATLRDLYAMVKQGKFREDLYHRIAVGEITMPSLDARPEDIPLLAKTYLEDKRCEITPSALAVLQDRKWSGNVRELQNVLERSRAECPRPLLDASDLVLFTEGERAAIARMEAEARAEERAANGEEAVDTLEDLDRRKREICESALRKAHGNKSAAARALEVAPRTLNSWLAAWGL